MPRTQKTTKSENPTPKLIDQALQKNAAAVGGIAKEIHRRSDQNADRASGHYDLGMREYGHKAESATTSSSRRTARTQETISADRKLQETFEQIKLRIKNTRHNSGNADRASGHYDLGMREYGHKAESATTSSSRRTARTQETIGSENSTPKLVDQALQKNAAAVGGIAKEIHRRSDQNADRASGHYDLGMREYGHKAESATTSSSKICIISIDAIKLSDEYCKRVISISNIFSRSFCFLDKNGGGSYSRAITMPFTERLLSETLDIDKFADDILKAIDRRQADIDTSRQLQAMLLIDQLGKYGILNDKLDNDHLMPIKQGKPKKTCIFVPEQDKSALELALRQQKINYETFTVDSFLRDSKETASHSAQKSDKTLASETSRSSYAASGSSYLSAARSMSSFGESYAIRPTRRI